VHARVAKSAESLGLSVRFRIRGEFLLSKKCKRSKSRYVIPRNSYIEKTKPRPTGSVTGVMELRQRLDLTGSRSAPDPNPLPGGEGTRRPTLYVLRFTFHVQLGDTGLEPVTSRV